MIYFKDIRPLMLFTWRQQIYFDTSHFRCLSFASIDGKSLCRLLIDHFCRIIRPRCPRSGRRTRRIGRKSHCWSQIKERVVQNRRECKWLCHLMTAKINWSWLNLFTVGLIYIIGWCKTYGSWRIEMIEVKREITEKAI